MTSNSRSGNAVQWPKLGDDFLKAVKTDAKGMLAHYEQNVLVAMKEAMAEVAKHIPVGRFGEPEEMAHLAMALLDGYNMYTTGQSFMIAGGYNVALDSGKFV